jgi:hypothetical protein
MPNFVNGEDTDLRRLMAATAAERELNPVVAAMSDGSTIWVGDSAPPKGVYRAWLKRSKARSGIELAQAAKHVQEHDLEVILVSGVQVAGGTLSMNYLVTKKTAIGCVGEREAMLWMLDFLDSHRVGLHQKASVLPASNFS